MPDSLHSDVGLPNAIQIGFAGARRLVNSGALPADAATKIVSLLRDVLRRLPDQLNADRQPAFVGISQLAIGADTLFTRACAAEAIPQRVFLPQSQDLFFSAVAVDGTPDFSPAERQVSESLLSSPHIIQVRVVSNASDRQTRFVDTSREILKTGDIAIGLLREDTPGKPGGTDEFLKLGVESGKPTLKLLLRWDDVEPRLQQTWHNLDRDD